MRFGTMIITCILLLSTLMIPGCANDNQPETSIKVTASKPVEPMPIRTVVISSSPNVQKVTFHSESLDKDMKFNIYLPKGYDITKKYPVLYMLHGYSGTEDSWLPELGLDVTADAMISANKINPLIIISPQINNSYGFNSISEGDYSDYIVNDLIQYVDGHFNTNASRVGRYIGGLSMGGWAALFNAFQHPALYSKVGGHSPALFMDYWGDAEGLRNWLYPSEQLQDQRDPLRLVETQNLKGLSIYLDSGDEDGFRFYEGAEALYQQLQSKNVNSEYHHGPGGHDGDYWRKHTSDYLLFYSGK
ncbi:alpha/beta hydrolase [Paenibacillus macquariensis]|uniref:Enterochelin esterase n=1 Tax=Paenibacillus macquariensis TaxID=948756 RepID=A0ABY1JNF8_9BACL|nr:alpha/beta hydrolase-fold protein [Paenibacillus macquariensis]MEC0092168.1 alpha/beta hydrolase-fold protein [Paenibacillus macquariensis]SIQ49808.1 Enterochelin esterase [Paenibacillus macquariensis]